MPYNSLADLPDSIKELPKHGQEIFLATFNSAYAGTCKDRSDKEECAFKIAWSAVKNKYEKKGDEWTARTSSMFSPFELSSQAVHEPSLDQDGSLIIPFVRDGTEAFDSAGKKHILTAQALDNDFHTWKGGIVTVNHKVKEKGTISEVWRKDGFVYGKIKGLSEEARKIIDSPAYRGVSQESIALKSDEKGNILSLKGTGLTLVIYPEKPACDMNAGCGVVDTASSSNIPLNNNPSKITSLKSTEGGTEGKMTEYTKEQFVEVLSFVKSHPEYIDDGIKSTMKELLGPEVKSSESDLKKEVETLREAIRQQTDASAKAIKSAIEEREKELRNKLEYDQGFQAAVTELRSMMRKEAVDELLAGKPTLDTLKGTITLLKSSGMIFSAGVAHGYEGTKIEQIRTRLQSLNIPAIEFTEGVEK